MRPTVGETLAYVRGLLVSQILPEVHAPYAKRLGDELVANLARVEQWWPRVIPNLMEENDELVALFEAMLAYVDGHRSQAGTPLEELASRVRHELSSGGQEAKYPAYSHLEATNSRYRALLELAIDALESLDGSPRDEPELSALRQRIGRHVGKYLEREVELRGIDIMGTRQA